MPKILKIQKLHEKATVPTYANVGDAGMDVYALERTVLKPGIQTFVPTGIAVALPKGTVGLVWDKSGLASKHGIKVLGGVIDEGYRGEIRLCLVNLGKKAVTLEAGHKAAQMLVQQVHRPTMKVVVNLNATQRGAKGFGSSGK